MTAERIVVWLDADDYGQPGDAAVVNHLAECDACRELVDRMELYFKAAAETLVDDEPQE